MTVLPKMATGSSSYELNQAGEARNPREENHNQLRERVRQLRALNAQLQAENRRLKKLEQRFAPQETFEDGTQNMHAPFKSIKP